jgi:hypothetical protein
LITVIVLFVGLAVAATLQFTVGRKHVQCPGPHARLGSPSDTVRCESPSPTPSPAGS